MSVGTGAAGVCEKCGQPFGAPHVWYDDDCVLDHTTHTDRYVGLICRRHYHWIDETLQQILDLYALLGDVIEAGTGQSDARPSGEVFAPAPGRLDVMAITDPRAKTPVDLEDGDIPDLPGALSSWAHLTWRERDGEEPTPDVATSIRVLRKERHWIAQQPWIDDYCLELAFLHRALARAVGDSMWPRPIGSCPNCNNRLFNTIGVDEVTCTRCKAVWSGLSLARLRLIHEQEAG